MKPLTANQLRAIHALFNKNGLTDDKKSIVSSFTAGRSESTKDLSYAEAGALIGHLKSLDVTDKRSDKMRNKILSLAHEMNWTKKGYVDMERINSWCMKYGHAHKALDGHTYEELPKLVSQFEEVYKQYLKGV
jgi:hypothetical protein